MSYTSLVDPYEGPSLGIYELQQYSKAKSLYKRLVQQQEEYFQGLYDDIAPGTISFDPDDRIGCNTERIALEIIDNKGKYLKHKEKVKRRAEHFIESLESLDPLEKLVIKNAYWGHQHETLLDTKEFLKVQTSAEGKMIDYISRVRRIERIMKLKNL